jgi:hypothetical protein
VLAKHIVAAAKDGERDHGRAAMRLAQRPPEHSMADVLTENRPPLTAPISFLA